MGEAATPRGSLSPGTGAGLTRGRAGSAARKDPSIHRRDVPGTRPGSQAPHNLAKGITHPAPKRRSKQLLGAKQLREKACTESDRPRSVHDDDESPPASPAPRGFVRMRSGQTRPPRPARSGKPKRSRERTPAGSASRSVTSAHPARSPLPCGWHVPPLAASTEDPTNPSHEGQAQKREQAPTACLALSRVGDPPRRMLGAGNCGKKAGVSAGVQRHPGAPTGTEVALDHPHCFCASSREDACKRFLAASGRGRGAERTGERKTHGQSDPRGQRPEPISCDGEG